MRRSPEKTRSGPYRARDGMIFGVCKGMAEHLGLPVFWVRFFAVVVLCFTGVWPVAGVYCVAWFLMKPKPVVPFESEADEEFYNSYTTSRRMALHRLKRTFDRLDRRIRRMESTVTAREYDWDQRLDQ